jgi:hypothetical protein
MGINGDFQSLAEACGEVEPRSRGWVVGVNFDPSDPDEMEVMDLVWDRERHDRIAYLERENARLRSLLDPTGVDCVEAYDDPSDLA